MSTPNRYLLAIESAIAGGSLALFNNDEVISSRCGEGSFSRAEDLLPNIISMLAEAGVSKNDLGRVAVSLGPGSYTGLRIGIAAVMGLKRGLAIDYVGVPLFEALAGHIGYNASPGVIAVPMGKADVCFAFSKDPESPKVLSMDSFVETVLRGGIDRLLVYYTLKAQLTGSFGGDVKIEELDPNLAGYIGRAAMDLSRSRSLHPIYVQNPRFG